MTIGHNVRYGLLSEFSPMHGRDMRTFFEDPGTKMRWQVEYDKWRRRVLFYDARMGPYEEGDKVAVFIDGVRGDFFRGDSAEKTVFAHFVLDSALIWRVVNDEYIDSAWE